LRNKVQFRKLSISPTEAIEGNTCNIDKSSNVFLGHTLEPLEPLEPIRTLPRLLKHKNSNILTFWHTHLYIYRERKKESNIKKEREREEERGNKTFQNFLFKRKFFNEICLVATPVARLGGLLSPD